MNMERNNKPIARMREKAGLTQSELANLIGVSENTIANWEKGGASKWIKNLNKLCKVLDCELENLDPELQPKDKFEPDLTPDILKTIESYCVAISENEKKTAAKIASFATFHDKKLRFWLKQTELIINQWQQKHKNKIDSEFILNSLVLQNLSLKLSSTSPNKVPLKKFRELTEEVKLSQNFLNRYIHYDQKNFSRKLLFQTKYLCVYVIGWEPGQISFLHHHGNSLDAIWIIEGKMDHWLLSSKECQKMKCPHESHLIYGQKYTEKPAEVVSAENWIHIDRHEGHQIENSSNKRLASFHVRFGAPPDDDNWEVEVTEEQPEIIGHLMEEYQVMST